LLTDFVCLYTYEFLLSLWKIVRSSVILVLPLYDKMKKKIPHCRDCSNIKYQNRRKRQNRYTNTQIHDRLFFWPGTGISIKKKWRG